MSLVPWFGWGRGGDRDWLTSELWDPFGAGLGLDRGDRGGDRDDTTALALANADWRETDEAHIFRADIPVGICALVSPGCELARTVLSKLHGYFNVFDRRGEERGGQGAVGRWQHTADTWGEVKEHEDKGDKWHHVERRRGSFRRRFRLPENVKLDEIKCNLQNGVLTVVVPKNETQESQKNVKAIDVA
ncbi:unnamed protein product [Dovyalis caffra]|uniref:SHSP domain-containing protein n=1 Tax=Dovyalis caffra TaxID=77055 RepID=A0AAV1S869_9ROSI|nr:unnamed protein product [Dovyalis caffra]